MFEPFITRHSIQYANGADGKARRLVYDKIFNYDKLDIYYDRLQKVWNVVDWAFFSLFFSASERFELLLIGLGFF